MPRTREEIFSQLVPIVVDKLDVKPEDVVSSAGFVETLNADSLDQVELIMELEEQFGFKINDEAAEKLVTVQDAINYIYDHQDEE